MALDQSALLEVLHVLKTAKVDDRIRRAAETVYQALIEAELTGDDRRVPSSAHGGPYGIDKSAPSSDRGNRPGLFSWPRHGEARRNE